MVDVDQKGAGIIWLASFPKSGNTWTRAFLHNLLKVMQGETGGLSSVNKMTEYSTWDINSKLYEKFLGKSVTDATPTEIALARPKAQAELSKQSDGMILVKTHNALVLDNGVPTINFAVTSGAIYVVRNPLDLVISFAHHFSTSIDDAIGSMEKTGKKSAVSERVVYEVYGSWSQHVESWTKKPHKAIYIMRYEDMLDKPLDTFGKLAKHLLLDPTPEQLLKSIELSSFDRLRALEDEEGFVEKPKKAERFFREGKSGQWQSLLSDAQISRIVSTHNEQMRRFGYLPAAGSIPEFQK